MAAHEKDLEITFAHRLQTLKLSIFLVIPLTTTQETLIFATKVREKNLPSIYPQAVSYKIKQRLFQYYSVLSICSYIIHYHLMPKVAPIYSILPCVCSVKGYGRRQNATRTQFGSCTDDVLTTLESSMFFFCYSVWATLIDQIIIFHYTSSLMNLNTSKY